MQRLSHFRHTHSTNDDSGNTDGRDDDDDMKDKLFDNETIRDDDDDDDVNDDDQSRLSKVGNMFNTLENCHDLGHAIPFLAGHAIRQHSKLSLC